MKKALHRFALAACFCAVAAVTSSCSWMSSKTDDPTAEWSADRLYSEARDALDDSNWSLAKEYYTKLESRYPFGRYAQQAQIEMAYAAWKDEDPEAAIQACDRFLRSYPNHPASDYVLYLKALATLNEDEGFFARLTKQDISDRDANAARDAFDVFKLLVEKYPDSRYAPEARRRMHELVLARANHELKVAKFYYDRHGYVAAIQRAQRVVTDYQQTPYSDDALKVLADSYAKLGMKDREADVRRVIQMNKDRKLD
ncbi:outer membrane protein assembly factor BamD [Mesosutterella sp. AGMB02718]|uniref:Outer membrane protein assembly factor BamD n=1 Tax=Mesosutterella faecium TaxID=2925194 RepID=A0ABT7IJ61_9BURK|nr:outer membrane protein assembly factor BamD [Mesosutterella sp. AGMB02718]MDL2058404.1 outer membrane protein assembly factor BamD [Mesosutterella sp. AGMB02718]